MLNVKDLMIGDWVEIDGKIGTVSFLDKEGYINVAINEIQMIVTRNPNPIPLTAEILEKNNWRSIINGTGEFYLKKPLVDAAIITKTITGFQMNHGPFNGLSIHCVHQLQHALQLCGIAKEIIL